MVAINVLEHIEDDSGALRALASLVEPGGRIVLWVPGYQQLYGDFDRAVGHVRRYTPRTLTSAFVGAGLTPDLVRPVNLLGGIAWWLTVRRGGVNQPRGPPRAHLRPVRGAGDGVHRAPLHAAVRAVGAGRRDRARLSAGPGQGEARRPARQHRRAGAGSAR